MAGFEVPRRLGLYELLEVVGSGGMGVVYRARCVLDARREEQGGDVALKLLNDNCASDLESSQRFLDEANLGMRLKHPGIVRVLDAFESGGEVAVVMELLVGESVEQLALRSGPLPWGRIRTGVLELVDAISYANCNGVIHRDIKPPNVMVRADGSWAVLDFGVAKTVGQDRTLPGSGFGTPAYMAPEQALDAASVGPAADVYGLGMTLYRLLAGRLPWEPDASLHAVLWMKAEGGLEPPSRWHPSVPDYLDAAVLSALVPDPSRRVASAAEFAALLTGPNRNGRAGAGQLTETAPLEPWVATTPLFDTQEAPRGAGRATLRSVAGGLALVFLPLVAALLVYGLFEGGPEEVAAESPMVEVPEGAFEMGCAPGDPDCFEDETPTQVTLVAFEIDRLEVTAKSYELCVKRGGCSARQMQSTACNSRDNGGGAHPANCVTWEQAAAFCAWIGRRLPREQEWEKAARGPEARIYPWGNEVPDCSIAVMSEAGTDDESAWGCSKGVTAPVGSRPAGASPYGALDMAGNVWEWTTTRYVDGQPHVVIRGGGMGNGPVELRTSYRYFATPAFSSAEALGFRCAR